VSDLHLPDMSGCTIAPGVGSSAIAIGDRDVAGIAARTFAAGEVRDASISEIVARETLAS
jgi:hypothetical protein